MENKPMGAVSVYGFAMDGRLREAFDINFGVIENENKNKKTIDFKNTLINGLIEWLINWYDWFQYGS